MCWDQPLLGSITALQRRQKRGRVYFVLDTQYTKGDHMQCNCNRVRGRAAPTLTGRVGSAALPAMHAILPCALGPDVL